MMAKGTLHLLFFTLIIKSSLNYSDAILFVVNPSYRTSTSTRINQQRSTIDQHQLIVPSAVCSKQASKPASILNLKMTHTIYWFRKALRIHDNPSLVKSIMSTTNLVPIFCLDPWFVKSGKVGVNRMGFLLESLTDLDQNLRKVGSKLLIINGNPVEEIPK
jgi:hypothetical protein